MKRKKKTSRLCYRFIAGLENDTVRFSDITFDNAYSTSSGSDVSVTCLVSNNKANPDSISIKGPTAFTSTQKTGASNVSIRVQLIVMGPASRAGLMRGGLLRGRVGVGLGAYYRIYYSSTYASGKAISKEYVP